MAEKKKTDKELKINLKKVEEIIAKWKSNPHFVIEMMQDIQDHYRYVPKEALKHVADKVKIPLGQLYHISTFYKSFSLKPKGKHAIHVCTGTACHVKGAPMILDALSRELKIKEGETDKTGNFSLDSVRCVGCCGLAPVVTINEELHGDVTAASVPKLLKKYQTK